VHQACLRRRRWRHGPQSVGSLPLSIVVGQSVDFGRILVDFSQILRDLVVAGRLQLAVAFWV
jgi:hypothetical protein